MPWSLMKQGSAVTINARPGGGVVIRQMVEIEVPAGTSMLEAETLMQAALVEAGAAIVGEFLHASDADGQPLEYQKRRFTAKAEKESRVVECTFGAVTVSRWAYQSSRGGKCYYPLDHKMELAGSATPKLARSLAFKMAHAPAARVCQDLEENHSRKVSVHFVQATTDLIGELALELQPVPDTREMPDPRDVAVIGVGIDGATLQITVEPDEPGKPSRGETMPVKPRDQRKGRRHEWRVAMVGTITFYNKAGERLGTIYTGCAPPEVPGEGKEDFWFLMERELATVKARYPKAVYHGISDGARDFVPWLKANTDKMTLDFFHAAGYLSGAASGMVAAGKGQERRTSQWLTAACHQLKHADGAAAQLLAEMQSSLVSGHQSLLAGERLEKAVTYFENNLDRMDYAAKVRAHHPIGSGVTEAACGLIIKDRMCNRGMRWSLRTAQHIITLRSIINTTANCWQNFWKAAFSNPVT
jgi:hypothetical protein